MLLTCSLTVPSVMSSARRDLAVALPPTSSRSTSSSRVDSCDRDMPSASRAATSGVMWRRPAGRLPDRLRQLLALHGFRRGRPSRPHCSALVDLLVAHIGGQHHDARVGELARESPGSSPIPSCPAAADPSASRRGCGCGTARSACSPVAASAQTVMSGSSAMMLARPIRTR